MHSALCCLVLWLAQSGLAFHIQIEEANEVHFRRIGDVAGTVATAHIIMSVDVRRYVELARELCQQPKRFEQHVNFTLSRAEVQLLEDLQLQCDNLKDELNERRQIWKNKFNKKAKRSATWCPNSNPLLPVREKRSVVAIISSLIAVASAIYTQAEMRQLSSKMHAQQEVNIQLLQEHQTRLSINTESIRLINSTLGKVGLKISGIQDTIQNDEIIQHLSYTINNYVHEVTRIIRGLNTLAMHKLSPDLIKTEEMSTALTQLRIRMLKEGYKLGVQMYDDVFRCATSHMVFANGTMVVVLHLPAFKTDSKLKLYEYLPVPVMVRAPERDGSVALFANPERELLAVTPDGTAFKAFTKVQLMACQKIGGLHFCPESNLYDRRTGRACVVGLYRRDHPTIVRTCEWKSVAVEEYAVQLGTNRILLYQPLDREIKMVCGKDNANESAAQVQGLKQIWVPAGCKLYTNSFTFVGQENFSVALTITLEKKINFSKLLDLSEFRTDTLGDVMHDLKLVGSSSSLTIENIRHRYDQLHSSNSWLYGFLIAFVVLVFLLAGAAGLWLWWKLRRNASRKGNAVMTLKQYVPSAFSCTPTPAPRTRFPSSARAATRPLSAPSPPCAAEAAALLGRGGDGRGPEILYEQPGEDTVEVELRTRHRQMQARAEAARRSQALLHEAMIAEEGNEAHD